MITSGTEMIVLLFKCGPRVKQVLQMSLPIKVLFQEKIYRFAAGVATLEQITQQMKKKYWLQLPPIDYYFQNIIVDDLPQLLIAVQAQGKSSLKLEARPSPKIQQSQLEIKPLQKKFNDESIAEVVETFTETLSRSYSMPKDFYLCFNCEGAGVVEGKEKFQLVCETCNGRGELDNDHKYVIRIKRLFQKYMGAEIKHEQPKKQSFQHTFLQINEVFDISISEVNKIDRAEIGKQFMHQFEVENLGQDLPELLQVVDCETMQSSAVKTLRSGEKAVLRLGPFLCEDEQVLRKSYHLCYRAENGWVRIGHRFGLRVLGFRRKEKKVEEETMQLIKDLKMLSGSEKSEGYLAVKLKEMGIDLKNIEMQDEILIQIIKGID